MKARHAIHGTALAALLVFGFAVASCKKPDGASSLPPPPPDTHESLSAEVIELNNMFIESIANTKNKEDAAAVITGLDDLAARYESVAMRMAALPPPSVKMKQKFAEMVAANEIVIRAKADEFIQVMLGDETLGPVLQAGMEEFNARVERLEILEEWIGGPGGTGADEPAK